MEYEEACPNCRSLAIEEYLPDPATAKCIEDVVGEHDEYVCLKCGSTFNEDDIIKIGQCDDPYDIPYDEDTEWDKRHNG